MAKAQRKIALADQHQIPVLTVTEADLPNLPTIFAKWLPPEGDRQQTPDLPPRPAVAARKANSTAGANARGQNPTNAKVRSDRLERCRSAVELQGGGATSNQIAEHLGVHPDVVASLLRDGKFFANPESDRFSVLLPEVLS
jgi:hypothetical protein